MGDLAERAWQRGEWATWQSGHGNVMSGQPGRAGTETLSVGDLADEGHGGHGHIEAPHAVADELAEAQKKALPLHKRA